MATCKVCCPNVCVLPTQGRAPGAGKGQGRVTGTDGAADGPAKTGGRSGSRHRQPAAGLLGRRAARPAPHDPLNGVQRRRSRRSGLNDRSDGLHRGEHCLGNGLGDRFRCERAEPRGSSFFAFKASTGHFDPFRSAQTPCARGNAALSLAKPGILEQKARAWGWSAEPGLTGAHKPCGYAACCSMNSGSRQAHHEPGLHGHTAQSTPQPESRRYDRNRRPLPQKRSRGRQAACLPPEAGPCHSPE